MSGATGFVGSALVDAALAAGHQVKALTRRDQPARDGVEWISGALDRPEALATLAAGADAVIHVAGVINADAAGFEAGNVAGTAAMLAAAKCAGVTRFVHLSSLAAREPGLSAYGASKARAEKLVEASPLATVMVRPPAVYGPGDRETLDLFRMARFGVVATPGSGRLSLIHVADLARLLSALAASDTSGVVEPDDGRPGGWSHAEFGRALGAAVGRKVAVLPLPRPVISLGAWLDRLVRGKRAKLTPDRVAYFYHPDWTVDPGKRPEPALWRPEVDTATGLAATARWYRSQGWL